MKNRYSFWSVLGGIVVGIIIAAWIAVISVVPFAILKFCWNFLF